MGSADTAGRRPRPMSLDAVADHLATTLADRTDGHPLRLAIDGAPAAPTGPLVAGLLERLPAAGRPALHIDTAYFLRPASLRLERGRTDPDAYFEDRLDADALRREVLDPAGPAGSRAVLRTLWDPESDRSTRAPYETVPDCAVLLIEGTFLLAYGLPFDLSVHVRLSAGALQRRTPADRRWTLPAFERYERQVAPAGTADVVVLADDPRHPAMLARTS